MKYVLFLQSSNVQIIYMKVRSFKLLPGIDYTGTDIEFLHPDADGTDSSTDGVQYTKRKDTDTKKFRNEFVLSVDGERLDPGHGITCEVHQGLVKFIADYKLGKYQPTALLKPSDPTPPPREYTESELRLRRWANTMQGRLEKWNSENLKEPGHPGPIGELELESSSTGKGKAPAEVSGLSKPEVAGIFAGERSTS